MEESFGEERKNKYANFNILLEIWINFFFIFSVMIGQIYFEME